MPESTVIIGAGIIGVSTAYYLSQSVPGESIHLIESSPELFASASGKAGGFLAADWFAPASSPLGHLSFNLHKQLADQHNGNKHWGYSTSTGTSFTESRGSIIPTRKKNPDKDWLQQGNSRAEVAGTHEFYDGDGPAWLVRRSGDSLDFISEDETVALVDPLRLSRFLLEECRKRGVRLHQPAEATSVVTDEGGRMTELKVKQSDGTETEVPCTSLLFAAGAWTPKIYQILFPNSKLRIPISPLAGHSIVITSPNWTVTHEPHGCHAVFSTSSSGFSPELMSRIGGEIYIAGLNDANMPLPKLATDSTIDDEAIETLKKTAERLCGVEGREVEVVRRGLCFRPVTRRGEPILCRVKESELGGVETEGGVFVAAGHGPWGISLSLGTGLVVSEMIRGVKTSCRVDKLGLR